MIKKILLTLSFVSIFAVILNASSQDVREMAKSWRTGTVAVSTTTVTAITCGNDTNFFKGRYKITIQNADPTWFLSIGSSTVHQYAIGYVVNPSTWADGAQITLPLQAGTSIYALGQPSNTNATVTIRCIEYK